MIVIVIIIITITINIITLFRIDKNIQQQLLKKLFITFNIAHHNLNKNSSGQKKV